MGEYRDKKSEQSFSLFAFTLNRVLFFTSRRLSAHWYG